MGARSLSTLFAAALVITACSGGQTSTPPGVGPRDTGTDPSIKLDAGGLVGLDASEAAPDADATDAGVGEDATSLDAETADVGADDATTLDATTLDATPQPDAMGPSDAEISPDATSPDASADAGAPDATVDAGTPDAGPASGTVLILAGGPSGVVGAHLSSGTGWTTTSLGDATSHAPALAATAGGATGLVRSTSGGGELRATTFAAGTFSALAALGPAITSREAPAAAGSASAASFVFHGDDYRFYFAQRAATWAPTAEPVIPASGVPSFGPHPAAITALAGDLVVLFVGNDGDLYDQRRSGGVWLDAHAHALGLGNGPSLTPSIVALSSGPELLAVFVRSSDARIVTTARTNGTWSAAAPIDANAFTNDPVALTALPGGDALVAYRGQDGMLYWSTYSAGAWSVPAAVSSPNVASLSRPAVASGVHGFTAELAFVAADGVAHHARLSGTTWSTPVVVGGTALAGVAIATMP